MNNTQPPPATPLQEELETLKSTGVDQYDPVRFRFLEAMARRAARERASVQKKVEEKTRQALALYQSNRTKQLVDTKQPAQSDEAAASGPDLSGLRELTELLQTQQSPASSATSSGFELDEYLIDQEQLLLQTLIPDAIEQPNENTQSPLKSVRRFRRAQQTRSLNRRVSAAIQERPENPGPLNPQMLAIRALTHMRDLSPAYVNRFMAYTDTLLWLEKAKVK